MVGRAVTISLFEKNGESLLNNIKMFPSFRVKLILISGSNLVFFSIFIRKIIPFLVSSKKTHSSLRLCMNDDSWVLRVTAARAVVAAASRMDASYYPTEHFHNIRVSKSFDRLFWTIYNFVFVFVFRSRRKLWNSHSDEYARNDTHRLKVNSSSSSTSTHLFFPRLPTDPSTILELQDPSIDVSELHIVVAIPGFCGMKVVEGSVGLFRRLFPQIAFWNSAQGVLVLLLTFLTLPVSVAWVMTSGGNLNYLRDSK